MRVKQSFMDLMMIDSKNYSVEGFPCVASAVVDRV